MTKHLLYCPLLGLGLYGGHRGKRWLRNRIKIFKQFVVPSLLNQSNKNFILWISVRLEDRNDSMIAELKTWLVATPIKAVFTYSGVCFWDDKYSDEEAHNRLIGAIHGAVPGILEAVGECDYILMTIQPSDDCYWGGMVEQVQQTFEASKTLQAVGYKKGFVMDYKTKSIAEWNPTTNPPFYTIRFAREVFIDPRRHVQYAGIKSHEYLTALNLQHFDERGFLVGIHGENISTVFNHPFRGADIDPLALEMFGLAGVEPLVISTSWRKLFMRRLPHGWQRKLRYWFGERFAAKLYDFLRS